MNNNKEQIIYFGESDYRNERKRFGIKAVDRSKHMYVIGKTGMGKTTLLENMAIQDILMGNGIGIIDPHGDFAEKMLEYIPRERIKDVVYFNPVDMKNPVGFNVLEDVDEEQRHLVAAGLMGVFKKIWPDVWSARMEYILSNTVLALIEYPGATILGINRMLSDKEYRKKVVDNLKDEVVKAFWTQEFAKYTERFAQEATPAIQNKIGQFITNPLMRNIMGQEKSTFSMREIMDNKKILIMNLSKGRIGEGNSHLLGAMLVTKLYLAAMSRVDTPEKEREPFYLYVDEFQNFATDAFASILSEARKYALSLIIAHQYIGQLVTDLNTRVRDAVFGNIGTTITFRVGAADAEFLEKEFAPEFTTQELVNLPFAKIYLRLMIDGVASMPFSASTLPPIEKKDISFADEIIKASSDKYGTPIEEVKEVILAGLATTDNAEADKKDQQKFETKCSACHKKIFVPFQPDGKRPVYCEEHLKNPPQVEVPRVTLNKPTDQKPELQKHQFAVDVPTPKEVSHSKPSVSTELNRSTPQNVTGGFTEKKRDTFKSNIIKKTSETTAKFQTTFQKRTPNIKEGELVTIKPKQNQQTISLKDLKPKFEPKFQRAPNHTGSGTRKSPDLSALRDVLKDSLEETKSSAEANDSPTHSSTNSGELRNEKKPAKTAEGVSPDASGEAFREKKKILKPGDSIKF